MAEKHKSKTVRVSRAGKTTRIGHHAKDGKITSPAKSHSSSAVIRSEGATSVQKNGVPAAPIKGDIDPHQFAQDLLVSDKWIMEYLAR